MISITVLILEFLLLWAHGTVNEINNVTASALIVIEAAAIIWEIGRSEKLTGMQKALIAGFLFRLFLLYFDIYGKSIYSLPNSGADTEVFYVGAVRFAQTGDPGRGTSFSAVMGSIFSFVGTNRLYGQFIVMLFSVVSLLMFAFIANKLQLSEKQRTLTMWVVALLPNFAILSSIFLRESIVTMLISISLYIFSCWLQKGNFIRFVLAFVFVFASAIFHSGSVAVAVGYIAVLLLYDLRENKMHAKPSRIIPAVLLVIVIAFLYINYADVLFGKMKNIESLEDVGSTSAAGGSSYAQYVGNSSNPLNMVIYTIPRIVFFLFSPFPWQWRSIADIIAFVFSGMYYLVCAVCSIRFLRRYNSANRAKLVAYLIVAICTVFVFAWGVTNVGTATRHRDKMVILFAVILALSQATDSQYPEDENLGITKH